MNFKELTMKEEGEWMMITLVALTEIAENEKRLREAQELILIGTAMNLGYDKK